MRPASTLARILQLLLLAWIGTETAWVVWSWPRSSWMAIAGAVPIASGYSAALALEFLLVRKANRGDPAPQARWIDLARAWLAATRQALCVFGWRQPFRWNAVPDHLLADSALHGKRGVVFVHGFFCNRGFWTPWLRQVRSRGHPFVAVNLEPVFASIDDYAPAIEQAVVAVTLASGLPPLLVCHSMGGLATRAWLRAVADAGRVHHVVTIGTPHCGTWLGRFSRSPSGRQMAVGSEWLRQLETDARQQPQPGFTCWYSNCDNVVLPASSATLPAANNRLVVGAAHVDLAFRPQVMRETLSLLERGPDLP